MRKYVILNNMVVPILDDGRHVTDLLVGEYPPDESVDAEVIEEDNDDAQDSSESSDGEADYANTIVIGTTNTKLESESDSEHRNQKMK